MFQAIGLAILALGVIGFVFGIFQKVKAGRVLDAPFAKTGEVLAKGRGAAGPKGQISAAGNVICAQPLRAPLSGVPCLYYELTCTAEWKDGDETKREVIDDHKVAAQFALDDGSGQVWIDARQGGDFEPTVTKQETKGTGALGGLTGTELVFGLYKVQTRALNFGTKYTVREEVLPLTSRLYACGKLADEGGVIESPSWRQLILSTKSRDALLASATKSAKLSFLAGATATLVGATVAILGLFFEDEPTQVAPPPTPVAITAPAATTSAKPAAVTTPPIVASTPAPSASPAKATRPPAKTRTAKTPSKAK